jgi:hypothetical protein
VPLSTVATASSPSPACRPASSVAQEPRTRSSGSTRSSSDASRRRSLRRHRCPCCSGRCLPQVRSTCERSMDGRHWQRSSSISRLTSPPDSVLRNCRRLRHADFQHDHLQYPLRRIRRLRADAAGDRRRRDWDDSLPFVAEDHLLRVIIVFRYGEPRIDEPLALAYRRVRPQSLRATSIGSMPASFHHAASLPTRCTNR